MEKKKSIIGKALKEKYGKDYYKKMGSLGGSRRVPKGFAMMTPEKRSLCGQKGGRISRRGSKS